MEPAGGAGAVGMEQPDADLRARVSHRCPLLNESMAGWLFRCSDVLETRKWTTNRIEDILVSNSSLVSGLSEASGVKFFWVEVSQESLKTKLKKLDKLTY